VRVRIPLSWRTRNYVGTIFGGSMYGAVDPIYMLMPLFAHFVVDDDEIRTIKTLLTDEEKIDRTYRIDLVDREGDLHATVEKVISIRLASGG
jgi:hypothetical protein